MRHLHVPDRPDEPTSEHSARPNPDRQCRRRSAATRAARPLTLRSTFSNEGDGGAVDLVRGSRPRRVSPVRTDLGADCDRSRRGSGPISARVTTDLAAEHDRLNGGERGIRTPGAPGAQRFSRPPHSAALSSLHARQPLEPLDARAGDPTLPPPPRCATPWPTRAIRFSRLNRLSRINGIGRADRRQPREKNPRLRVGLADAGTGEAGLSRRPSAKACAIAGHTGRRGMSVACRAW